MRALLVLYLAAAAGAAPQSDQNAPPRKTLRVRRLLEAGPETDRSDLHQILTKAGSDKGSHHGYTRFYTPLFAPLRRRDVRLVEIGVERGASMKAWQLYFPNASHVYGIGFGDFTQYWSSGMFASTPRLRPGSSGCPTES